MGCLISYAIFGFLLFIWIEIKDIQKKLDQQDMDLDYIKDQLDE